MNIDFTEIGLDNNRVQATLLAYEEPYRFYHTRKHVDKMLNLLNKDPDVTCHREFLLLAAAIIYHDAVYVWGSETNEEESAKLVGRHFTVSTGVDFSVRLQHEQLIKAAILDTAPACITTSPIGFQGNTRVSDKLREYDLWDIHHGDRATIRQNIKNLQYEAACNSELVFGGSSALREFLEANITFVTNYGQSLEDPLEVKYYLDVVQEFLEESC